MIILTTILIIFTVAAVGFNAANIYSWANHIYWRLRGHDHHHFDYSGGEYLKGEQQMVYVEVGYFVVATLATILAILSIYVHAVLVINFAVTTVITLGHARGIRHQRLNPISHRFHL